MTVREKKSSLTPRPTPIGFERVETYQALVSNLSEGIALLSADWSVVSCNAAFMRILGCEAQPCASPFTLEAIHEEDRTAIHAVLGELADSPKATRLIEYRLRRSDAGWVWLEASLENMLDTPGVDAIALRVRDITQRKHDEVHLNRMRHILLESQRVGRFGSFEYVVATQETIWSEEEFRIYGLDPADGSPVYAQMLANNIHPEDADLLDRTFREAFSKRGVYELEHRIVRPDGTVRIVHDVAHPYFDNDGKLQKYIGTTHDVTEHRELEAQLLQVQKMESIGQLAGGIAHDFNNLLIPIMGHVELVMDALAPDDELRRHLEAVNEAADRAANLTHQILAFSRKQILRTRVLDLNAIIVDFESMTRRLIGEDIELRALLSPDLYRVRVDKGQVEQILLNLVINARDAMPSGGRLTVETSNVYLDEAYLVKHKCSHAAGHYAMLAVSDSGCGMDAATQKRIFEPFFTTKVQGGGTGLGLATVFGIVHQHRGSIWVYSEPNRGTTFKIYLPRAEGAVEASESHSEESADRGSGTILVVEDEGMVRQLMCETLEAAGYDVIEARTPNEALRLVTASNVPIDLLLTDIIMPEMNGRQLYERLEAIQPGVRVLYASGYTDKVVVDHGVLEDGVDFLQKPFTLQGLRRKVRQGLA